MEATDSKLVNIVVNSRQKQVEKNKELGHSELIALAYASPPTGPNIYFTISYRKGAGQPEQDLPTNETVKAKEGLKFNVTATDRS